MRLLPTAQPGFKISGVLPARLVEIGGGFAGEVGVKSSKRLYSGQTVPRSSHWAAAEARGWAAQGGTYETSSLLSGNEP